MNNVIQNIMIFFLNIIMKINVFHVKFIFTISLKTKVLLFHLE